MWRCWRLFLLSLIPPINMRRQVHSAKPSWSGLLPYLTSGTLPWQALETQPKSTIFPLEGIEHLQDLKVASFSIYRTSPTATLPGRAA